MKKKIFIRNIFIFLILYFLFYFFLFFYQLGAKPSPAEVWIDDILQVKDKIASNIKGRKIIILSGSNSLFGINSEIIRKELNLPVLNLGVSGGLDVRYLYFLLEKYIQKEDVVIMPLEYMRYFETGYTNWFVDNMMIWGADYIESLDAFELLKFILSVNPGRIISGVVAKFNDEIYVKNTNAILEWESNFKNTKWQGYSVKSLNSNGEINIDSSNIIKKYDAYLPREIEISKHFLYSFNKIKDLTLAKNASLFLTHPLTFKCKEYDLNDYETEKKLKIFSANLLKNNIHILFQPSVFHLDLKYAFNTTYHANKNGADIRTLNLAHCMKEFIKNDFDDVEARIAE